MRSYFTALLIGAIGAAVAHTLNLPAPSLTGPAICVSLAGVFGVKVAVPAFLRHIVFLIIGLALGSSVTPEVIKAAAAWPISLVGMCISVATSMILGGLMFQRFFGMDRSTAYLASSPGHLSFVLGYATDVGANESLISVVQSIRVLILTLAVPVAVVLLTDADISAKSPKGETLSILHLVLLTLISAGVGAIFLRLKIPAALLLAGMFVSTIGHGAGLAPGQVPQPLTIAGFVIMGTLIGTRFSGVTPQMLRRAAVGGLTLTFVAVLIAIVFSFAIASLTGLPLLDVIIAIAPGGLETMVAMSAIIGADPAYVAVHHVGRLVFLSVFVPVVMKWK